MNFAKLESLWKISYRAETLEPFLTAAATKEAKERVGIMIDKEMAKTELDSVPLVMGKRAVITGNGMKGVCRHTLSSQLSNAGHEDICVQRVKLEERERPPAGRKVQCGPSNPCFICNWFGTASRQGALSFGFLTSKQPVDEILLEEPIPMISVKDDYRAAAKRGFLLYAPLDEGVKFEGEITGENLDPEILGGIKEIQDMSSQGFIKLGAYKTRGLGAVKFEIEKIEEFSTSPFSLSRSYTGGELEEFLEDRQERYQRFLTSKSGSSP